MGTHRLLCALALALFAAASSTANNVRAEGATLLVNEVPVLTVRTPHAGLAPRARAVQLASRLQTANLGSATAERQRRTYRILFDGRPLLTVTPAEAKAGGGTPAAVAGRWVANVRKAAALPPLRLETSALRLQGGSAREIRLVGSKAHVARIETSDDAVVRATRTRFGVTLRGQGYGQGRVVVSANGEVQSIDVNVLPAAARFPQTVTAFVTGRPAAASIVAGATRGAIRAQFQAVNGANLSFDVRGVSSIPAGEARTVPIRVRATGPEAFPAEGVVNVVVRNLPIAPAAETELWYCNDPENVRNPQNLFAAPLRVGRPARMLYHHINMANTPLTVTVQAINDTDEPARLLVVPGDSPPDRNPVLAGLLAAQQFMLYTMNGAGEVVTVPPRSAIPISFRRLAPLDTMSGLCTLRLLDEGPRQIQIRTDAKVPDEANVLYSIRPTSDAPWRDTPPRTLGAFDRRTYVDSSHIYPDPFKTERFTYEVGGNWLFIRIGQRPIANFDQVKRLDGNFGVIYNIRADIVNPTPSPADVEVVFEASAGYSGALFVVNGEFLRTPLLQPKGESRLRRLRIESGESRSITLQTIPLSGSSYPAQVTIRPVQAR